MRHHRTALPLVGYTTQQVESDPATFQSEDLFWLPYYASLSGWGRKWQAEHLVGCIAAVYALHEVGEKQPPAISDQRQLLWPTPWFGNINHYDQRVLAVVVGRPVGVDTECRFTPQTAVELESSIISSAEKTALLRSGLPFLLALTLVFPAKESGFKVTPVANQCAPGFVDPQIVDITASTLAFESAEQRYPLHWIASEEQIIAFYALQQQTPMLHATGVQAISLFSAPGQRWR